MTEQFTAERLEAMPGLVKLTHPRTNEFIPADHLDTKRLSAKQEAFLLLDWVEEVFYGGAAGGGKSDALLMAALQYVDVPGYNAIILRKTFAELSKPEALMFRARQWLSNTSAVWNDRDHMWLFPSGATLSFGYMEHAGDEDQYQSAAYQFVAFDEVTEFSEYQYTFMFSRLRRLEGSNVPIRMRSASNPIGAGKEWVKQRFITEGLHKGRVFIKATMHDNPNLDVPTYLRTLGHLSITLQQALIDGDWDISQEGTLFKRYSWAYCERDDVPAGAKWVRWWDLAATEAPKKQAAKQAGDPDWTAGGLYAYHRGLLYVVDMVRFRENPGKTETIIANTASKDGRKVPIRMEQEPGASGKTVISHYRREVLAGYTFGGNPSSGSKEVRAQPVAARVEAGDVYLVKAPWNGDYVDEAAAFPTGPHDDQVDTLSAAYLHLAGKTLPSGVKPGGEVSPSIWRNVT